MRDRAAERLPKILEDGAALLREEPTLRPEWRAGVLHAVQTPYATDAIGAMRAPSARRRVTMSVPIAIAAALCFAVAGGVATKYAPRFGHGVSTSPMAANAGASTVVMPVRFSLVAPQAVKVSIVGDFNHWDPVALPLTRSADGRTWQVEVRLPLGHYSYAFLVDGKLARDPAAPQGASDDFGAPNSVVMVHGT